MRKAIEMEQGRDGTWRIRVWHHGELAVGWTTIGVPNTDMGGHCLIVSLGSAYVRVRDALRGKP